MSKLIITIEHSHIIKENSDFVSLLYSNPQSIHDRKFRRREEEHEDDYLTKYFTCHIGSGIIASRVTSGAESMMLPSGKRWISYLRVVRVADQFVAASICFIRCSYDMYLILAESAMPEIIWNTYCIIAKRYAFSRILNVLISPRISRWVNFGRISTPLYRTRFSLVFCNMLMHRAGCHHTRLG